MPPRHHPDVTDAAIPARCRIGRCARQVGPLTRSSRRVGCPSDGRDDAIGVVYPQLAGAGRRPMPRTGVMRDSDRDLALVVPFTSTSKETYKLWWSTADSIHVERDAPSGKAIDSPEPGSADHPAAWRCIRRAGCAGARIPISPSHGRKERNTRHGTGSREKEQALKFCKNNQAGRAGCPPTTRDDLRRRKKKTRACCAARRVLPAISARRHRTVGPSHHFAQS